MKRKLYVFIAAFLAAAMLLSPAAPAYTAFAEEVTGSENGLCYTLTDGKAVITGTDGPLTGEVTIPGSIGTGTVCAIGDGAFRDQKDITGITLPAGLEKIGKDAFSGCAGIGSLILPETCTELGAYAFAGCSALEKVTLPAALTQIPDGLFCRCGKLSEIALPEKIASVGEKAFTACGSLGGINFTDALERIGAEAFAGCSALETIGDPVNVRYIGTDAFLGTKWFDERPEGMNTIGKTLLLCKGPCERNVTVGKYTVSISARAFENCADLAGITLPEGLESIGENAFAGCAALEDVNLPESLTSLEDGAFSGCSLLKEMTVPEKITEISGALFRDCSSLEKLVLPDGLTAIGGEAFMNCESLTALTVPDKALCIGKDAFTGCGSLIGRALLLTDGELYLGGNLIAADASGAHIQLLPDAAPTDATPTDATATDATPTDATPTDATPTDAAPADAETADATPTDATATDATPTDATPTDAGTAAYIVKPGTRSIAGGAFAGADGFTKLVLPDGLAIISAGAFEGLKNVKEVNIPDTVKFIGENAFSGTSVKEFTLQNNTVAIEDGAFPADTILCGYAGSAAEKYAAGNGNPFITLCLHKNTVIKNAEERTCAGKAYSGDICCADCGELLQKGTYIPAVPHTWERGKDTKDEATGETGMIYTCKVCGAEKFVSYSDYYIEFKDSEKAKTIGGYIYVLRGTDISEIRACCQEGTEIVDVNGDPVPDGVPAGSAIKLYFPNTKDYTLLVYGDTDGDGTVSPADARFTLRVCVKLETAAAWQTAAAHVENDGKRAVTTEDARLILRASVGLEDLDELNGLKPTPDKPEETTTEVPEETTTEKPEETTTEKPEETTTEKPAPAYKTGYYFCTERSGVYLRSGPQKDASPMDIIKGGETVYVTEIQKDNTGVFWGRITHSGVTGWSVLEYYTAEG